VLVDSMTLMYVEIEFVICYWRLNQETVQQCCWI